MMTDVESILNDNECFTDTIDTKKEGSEQHTKQECSKVSKSKDIFTRW